MFDAERKQELTAWEATLKYANLDWGTAGGTVAALLVVAGCGTLPHTDDHPRISPEQSIVDVGEQHAAAPTADAPTRETASTWHESAEQSGLQTVVQRLGQSLKCGVRAAALGAAVPLLIAPGTAGLSVFLIPLTAPIGGIMGMVEGAKGNCPLDPLGPAPGNRK